MATMNEDNMTTQADLYREIQRQTDRLVTMTEPINRYILSSSISDLLKLVKVYPLTIWAATRPEGPGV